MLVGCCSRAVGLRRVALSAWRRDNTPDGRCLGQGGALVTARPERPCRQARRCGTLCHRKVPGRRFAGGSGFFTPASPRPLCGGAVGASSSSVATLVSSLWEGETPTAPRSRCWVGDVRRCRRETRDAGVLAIANEVPGLDERRGTGGCRRSLRCLTTVRDARARRVWRGRVGVTEGTCAGGVCPRTTSHGRGHRRQGCVAFSQRLSSCCPRAPTRSNTTRCSPVSCLTVSQRI